MKCYVTATYLPGSGWVGRVVSETDYHERGPHARSHQTEGRETEEDAKAAAREWAEENGYSIYSVDEIAA
jgi:hypothetical protein